METVTAGPSRAPATKTPAPAASGARADTGPGGGDPCPPFLSDCRLRAATELLAHTWDAVVLAGLRPGPRRRRDLLAWLGGVSDKALTETLRRLQANGLVTREYRPAAPPRVDYALTPLGASFVDGPLQALASWTLAHGEALLAAQEAWAGPAGGRGAG
jgi:DNA-binding HxlR family transcriptional regulator